MSVDVDQGADGAATGGGPSTRRSDAVGVSADVVDTLLASVLIELTAVGRAPARVFDCGGGSGRRAVPLALLGAEVTVVDSSIDALAILDRRAAEAGVSEHVTAVQADIESLADLASVASVDLVLLHDVLDSTPDGRAVVAAAAGVLHPGGYLSVVVPNPVAGVLARALGGDLVGALAELDPAGRAGSEPLDLAALTGWLVEVGLGIVSSTGLGSFSSLVPGAVLDGQPRSRAVLDELDRVGGTRSPYREIGARLHVLARCPDDDPTHGTGA